MDVISSATAIVGLVFNFTAAIKSCNDIRSRYKDAGRTIDSIKHELETLQGALQELANLMMHDASSLTSRWDSNKSLPTTFARAVRGFRRTIKGLLDDVEPLRRDYHDTGLGKMDKVKILWNENGMKAHLEQLRAQSNALQLLLIVLQTGSISEFKNNINQLENAVFQLSLSTTAIPAHDDPREDGITDPPPYPPRSFNALTQDPQNQGCSEISPGDTRSRPEVEIPAKSATEKGEAPATLNATPQTSEPNDIQDKPDMELKINSASKQTSPTVVEAVIRNNLSLVKEMLKAGFSINAHHPRTLKTGVHFAAYFGHFEILEFLLDNGATVDPRDKRARTPLHYAVSEGYDSCAKLLVSHGASIKVEDSFGDTPLHRAVSYNTLQTLGCILEKPLRRCLPYYCGGFKNLFRRTPLHVAARQGYDCFVHELLEYIRTEEHHDDCVILLEQNNSTMLQTCNCPASYPWLEEEDSIGCTPIQNAVNTRRVTTLSILLQKSPTGANAPMNSKYWSTKSIAIEKPSWERPLHRAIWPVNDDLVDVLLAANANPLLVDSNGRTALHTAARYAAFNAAQKLLEYDPLLVSKDDLALHEAVRYGRKDMTWIFLARGWSTSTRDSKGLLASEVQFQKYRAQEVSKRALMNNTVEDYEECIRLVQEAMKRQKTEKVKEQEVSGKENNVVEATEWKSGERLNGQENVGKLAKGTEKGKNTLKEKDGKRKSRRSNGKTKARR